MIRPPPRSTPLYSSAASDVYKRQEYGHGRKAGWITSFELAARDEDNEQWVPVGRVSSGASDEQLKELTEEIKPLIISERGRIVDLEPKVVLEVKFNEIQKSQN